MTPALLTRKVLELVSGQARTQTRAFWLESESFTITQTPSSCLLGTRLSSPALLLWYI